MTVLLAFLLPATASPGGPALLRGGGQDAGELVRRGTEKLDANDVEGAIADFTRAIEIDPKHARAWCSRGIARWTAGDGPGAIADFTRAIEIDPKYVLAYYNRGLASPDLDAAIADFTKALEIDPTFAAAYNTRGLARKSKGDLEGAIADYTKAVEIEPKYAAAFNNRGVARRAAGDDEGAIADFAKALVIDPKHVASIRNRGYLLYNLRRWKEALADFRAMGDSDAVALRIWLIRARLGEREDADRGLANRKRTRAARYLLGELAEEDYLHGLDTCEGWFYAGTKRLLDGDRKGAAELFRKCVAKGAKESVDYKSAAAELKELEKR